MASVLQQYHQLADRMATQITGSYQSWTDFLTTAARLYKYPYHEQLMIYAQRPEATACADYELWNKRMGRYVRRGAKGIALIDHSGDTPKLKYVFDVADTHTTERSRSPYLWEYRPEHEQVVSAAMAEQYNIQYPGNLVDQLEQISSVHLRDPSQAYPVFRAESKERLEVLLRQDERNAHLFAVKPPAISEEEKLILEHEGQAALSEMGELIPDPDDAISQAEPDEPPAHSPAVSILIDGQWQEFPSASAAEKASYADFKAASHQNAQNFRITDDDLGAGGAKAKCQLALYPV
jgi:hypothetical protein